MVGSHDRGADGADVCCPRRRWVVRGCSAARRAGNGTGSVGSGRVSCSSTRHELVITKAELDELHDELYVLACAVDDVERDLEAAGKKPETSEITQMLSWLLDAARPIRDRELSTQRP